MFRKIIIFSIAILLILNLCIFAVAHESILASIAAFTSMWANIADDSVNDYSSGHFFPTVYADGYWVASFGISTDDYMVIRLTSPKSTGQIASIAIVGRTGETAYFREMCAQSWLLLANPTGDVVDSVLQWLDTQTPMSELISITNSYNTEYNLSVEKTATASIGTIKSSIPYEVERSFDIPKEGSHMFPIMQSTKSVAEFEEELKNSLFMYGFVQDDLLSAGAFPSGDGTYMHAYLLETTVIGVNSDSESADGKITGIVLNDLQGDPAMLVAVSQLAFAALTNMTQEEVISMYYSAAGRTTWDDYLNKLPTIARDGKMLLFGIQSDGSPGGYIMGVPESP